MTTTAPTAADIQPPYVEGPAQILRGETQDDGTVQLIAYQYETGTRHALDVSHDLGAIAAVITALDQALDDEVGRGFAGPVSEDLHGQVRTAIRELREGLQDVEDLQRQALLIDMEAAEDERDDDEESPEAA